MHPEHSVGLADAGVLDTGSSTLQEMTREIYLKVDPLTLKSEARNLRTSTMSSGGGAMTHLDPDPVSGNGASYERQDEQRRSVPVPIVATRMKKPEPLMPDHAPLSIPTSSTTPAPAPHRRYQTQPNSTTRGSQTPPLVKPLRKQLQRQ